MSFNFYFKTDTIISPKHSFFVQEQVISSILKIALPPIVLCFSWFIAFQFLQKFFRLSNKKFQLGLSWFFLYSLVVVLSVLPFGVKLILELSIPIQITLLLVGLATLFVKVGSRMALGFKLSYKILLGAISLVCVYAVVLVTNFVHLDGREPSVFSSYGSLHTGKYSFLAQYIFQCQALPRIQHNLGQAILAFVTREMAGGTFTYALSWILALSLIALLVLCLGLLEVYLNQELSKKLIAIASVVMMFGNFGLSMAHVTVNDSGNPMFLVGYSDTLYGVFAVIFLSKLLTTNTNFGIFKNIAAHVLVLVTLALSNPQTLIILLVVIPTFLVIKSKWQNLSHFVISVAFGSLVWRGQSGMLGTFGNEVFKIPGVEVPNLASLSSSFLEIFSPGLPFLVGSFQILESEIEPRGIDAAKDFVESFGLAEYSRAFWSLEQFFISSLRPIFWPIVGLLIMFILSIRKKTFHNFDSQKSGVVGRVLNGGLLQISGFYLVITLPVSLLFKINNLKWEMSRFIFAPLTIGMVFLSLLICWLALRDNNLKKVILVAGVLATPTLIHVLLLITRNLPYFTLGSFVTEIGQIGLIQENILVKCLDPSG